MLASFVVFGFLQLFLIGKLLANVSEQSLGLSRPLRAGIRSVRPWKLGAGAAGTKSEAHSQVSRGRAVCGFFFVLQADSDAHVLS